MKQIPSMLDELIERTTMYRVVLYGLVWLVGVAALLSLIGVLSYPLSWLIKGGVALSVGSAVTNQALSWVYKVPSNHESSIITMLILFFILKPNDSVWGVVGFGIAGGVAMVTKYALTWRGSVVVNPAAAAALVVSLSGLASASWWVASKSMLVPVAIVSLVTLRKTRRFGLFASFAVPYIGLLYFGDISFDTIWYSFPVLFLGGIMLTEPATMPSTKQWRYVYGVLVGILCGSRLAVAGQTIGPHAALLVGNIFALFVSARVASVLVLERREILSPTAYEFVFRPLRRLRYAAGQYAEFTLPGVSMLSARGNRRTFTIASSPLDQTLSLGVKFYNPASLYKQSLLLLKPGDHVTATHVAGDFMLPRDLAKPVLFVAGGIGITPFISMIRHQIATNTMRDIVLLYFASSSDELAYRPLLDEAGKHGLTVVYFTDPEARLDSQTLMSTVPDIALRRAYISGPPAMVQSYRHLLRSNGVRRIKTDYFSGY